MSKTTIPLTLRLGLDEAKQLVAAFTDHWKVELMHFLQAQLGEKSPYVRKKVETTSDSSHEEAFEEIDALFGAFPLPSDKSTDALRLQATLEKHG